MRGFPPRFCSWALGWLYLRDQGLRGDDCISPAPTTATPLAYRGPYGPLLG